MNIWDWVYQIENDAFQKGDDQRLKMVETFNEAMDASEDNPDLALTLLAQSRQLANELQELWWVQLVNHWELQFRIYNKRDLHNTLELAAKSTVETRKPHYADFPQRICLHEDLIRVYMKQDPIGHMDMVDQALDYMEQELHPKVECFLCFQQLKISQKIHQNDIKSANILAHRLLDYARSDRFHLCHAYEYLCEIAYHQKNWEALGQWSYLGEGVAKTRDNNRDQLITFLMWQAVFERNQGNEDQAQQRFRSAVQRAARYKGGLGRDYYDGLVAYHEMGNELEQALKARQTYLEMLVNTAQYHEECECLLEIIRLSTALNLPTEEIVEQLNICLGNLKNPTPMREKLSVILKLHRS